MAFFLIAKGWEASVGATEDMVYTIIAPLITRFLGKAGGP